MAKQKSTCFPKDMFMNMVRQHLYNHPEWMEEIIKEASEGVLQKVRDNRETAVEVQHSFSMLYGGQYSKLSKLNKIKVNKAILECDALEGSPFAKKVKDRLEKLEQ